MLGAIYVTENTNYFLLLVRSKDEVKMNCALKNACGLATLLSA
jgi:hypothetical protein